MPIPTTKGHWVLFLFVWGEVERGVAEGIDYEGDVVEKEVCRRRTAYKRS